MANQILEPGAALHFQPRPGPHYGHEVGACDNRRPRKTPSLPSFRPGSGRFYGIPSGSWVSTESNEAPTPKRPSRRCAASSPISRNGYRIFGPWASWNRKLTVSPAQAVIDDEMIEYARRYLRGVEVSDETPRPGTHPRSGNSRIFPRGNAHVGTFQERTLHARGAFPQKAGRLGSGRAARIWNSERKLAPGRS